MANYEVPETVLHPFVPQGTTIDKHDGKVYVSLVAFLFNRMKVVGLPALFHRKFPEVNLRFYVAPEKDPSIRAVTFIREVVPRPLISFVANRLFNENYVSLPMSHRNRIPYHEYCWGRTVSHRFEAIADAPLHLPPENSLSEFITEHYWGYTSGRRHTVEYRVDHPQWRCCEVTDFTIDVDFGNLYGDAFSFLTTTAPANVLYAEGSRVTVSFPKRLATHNGGTQTQS